MPDRGRCVARGRSTHALGRHARERHRQTGAAAREGVLLVCFRGETHRFVTPSAPGTMLSTPQGSARRPNPTKYPRARASSTGAGRCWLDTTTPEGHFERYTTAPRPIQSLPGLAQNRFIAGSRDALATPAVAPRAAWGHRRPNTAVRGSMPASKMPKSPSSGVGTNSRRPSHSIGPPGLT